MLEERDGPAGPLASDGQPYTTLVHYGTKEEGEQYRHCVASYSQDEAAKALWAQYNQSFADLCAKHPGTAIEWRKRPVILFDGVMLQDQKYYIGHIRSRLAFIAKEAVAA